MDRRIVEFVAALRAAGVRISIAESEDAFEATRHLGVKDRRAFQDALRATIVKGHRDRPAFDRLFPLYFGSGGPPLVDLTGDLSPDEKEKLAQALQELLEQLRQAAQNLSDQPQGASQKDGGPFQPQIDALMQLLQWLLQGTSPTAQDLDAALQQAARSSLGDPQRLPWMQQRTMRELGMHVLQSLIELLARLLEELGMSQEAIDQLLAGMERNREALAEQIAQRIGAAAARQRADLYQQKKQDIADLMHRPFQTLTEPEAERLREQVRRLAAQLRSRAALRRKRGKRGALDVKQVMRSNLRYGGVPLEIKFKTRHLKPKILLVCDISTSMRPVVEFLLRMVYELQDQVATARTFAFVDDLNDISPDFAEHPPDVAIQTVLTRLPPGHYNTDLGNSLSTLMTRYAGAVDPRTTVIFVGDGRNNYYDPRVDLMERIQRSSKRVVWLNPEHPWQWGTGDSDMATYLPYADAVHRVSNLAELTSAVDKLLSS